jgi:hypothetical protein
VSKPPENDNDDQRDYSVDRGRSQSERLESKAWKQQPGQFGRRRKAPAGFNGLHRRRRRRIDW